MTAAAIPPALLPRVAQLVRMIGSPVDGEALAACRALGRTLAGCGADFHALADAIERQPDPVMIYVERQPRPTRAERGHIDWTPGHRARVSATLERGLLRLTLNPWEREFIANIVVRLRSPRGRLTFKQAEVAERLVAKVEMSR